MAQTTRTGWTVNTQPAAFAPNVNPQNPADVEQIDFPARIEQELAALNTAVTEFENDGEKTEQALVDAQQEVTRIKGELFHAEKRLEQLIAADSAQDKFNGSVAKVEGQFQKIVELFTRKVQTSILEQWYGHKVSLQAISADRKRDLSLHRRTQDLKKFVLVSRFEPKANLNQINKRADDIGNRLIELREHIVADQGAKS